MSDEIKYCTQTIPQCMGGAVYGMDGCTCERPKRQRKTKSTQDSIDELLDIIDVECLALAVTTSHEGIFEAVVSNARVEHYGKRPKSGRGQSKNLDDAISGALLKYQNV